MNIVYDIFVEVWPIIFVVLLGVFIGYIYGKRKSIKQCVRKAEVGCNSFDLEIFAEQEVGLSFQKRHDLIHSKEVFDFIFCDEELLIIYIHYTYREEDAANILKNGFNYIDSFYKTATLIVNDRIDFVYKHNLHKRYGKYAIIIAISRSLYDQYLKGLSKLGDPDLCVEHLFTEKRPYEDSSGELVYTCPPQFIRGYVNYETGEVVKNKLFDPGYDSPFFITNLNKYRDSLK